MAGIGEDIYEYQFNNLYNHMKTLIGGSTIKVYETDQEVQEEKEIDRLLGKSKLLFDISGSDYKEFKANDTEYKYWVEVYVFKMIESLLLRANKDFEEKYYPGENEQHSLVYELDKNRIQAYFLFDMEYEEATRTDYDKISDVLLSKSKNIDKINIYIFRDQISMTTPAWLINEDNKRDQKPVEVFPLQNFFEDIFGKEEYTLFAKYANDFMTKCNNIISYKTIITPTQKTLAAFRKKKSQMLMDIDYLSIKKKEKAFLLSDSEFERVKRSFLNNKMYTAMISSNDYADSFISAEWSYDVYSNYMGELELTGIIAGYLKSIEQLLYTIARFHKNQGIKIKTKEGLLPYSDNNEMIIDSTLGSLNDFVTSEKGKFALSGSIRNCIHNAVDRWRKYQRNGYFHKDNLYLSDNKLTEVRDLTLYLYFLILGGIRFSSEEIKLLGVDTYEDETISINEEREYPRFVRWLEDVINYDLPSNIPGIWILLMHNNHIWEAKPYQMKDFYIEEFETGYYLFADHIDCNHVRDIPSFSWKGLDNNYIQAVLQLKSLLDRYEAEPENKLNRIQAIIVGIDKEMQLIYFRE